MLTVAEDCILLRHPPPAARPPWQQPGRSGFERNPRECWTSPPYPTVCRSGQEGYPLPATLRKKVPYVSTKLARGSDAVLGTLRCPKHPDFITKGCRIVARFIPLADAALAVRGRVSPSAPAGPTQPCWDGEELGNAAGQGSWLPRSRPVPQQGPQLLPRDKGVTKIDFHRG